MWNSLKETKQRRPSPTWMEPKLTEMSSRLLSSNNEIDQEEETIDTITAEEEVEEDSDEVQSEGLPIVAALIEAVEDLHTEDLDPRLLDDDLEVPQRIHDLHLLDDRRDTLHPDRDLPSEIDEEATLEAHLTQEAQEDHPYESKLFFRFFSFP